MTVDNSCLEARYLDHKITKEQFLKIYRKPENYEVQHWKRNQSHMDEAG